MQTPSLQRAIIARLLDSRYLVFVIIFCVTIFLLYPLKDPGVLFDEPQDTQRTEDADGMEWITIAEKFGQGETMAVAIRADFILNPEVLRFISDLTADIAKIDGIVQVQSITTVQEIAVDPMGDLIMVPLFPHIPDDESVLEEKKQILLSNPLWAGMLLSSDARASVINVTLPPLTRGSQEAFRIIDAIQSLIKEKTPERIDVYLTGLSPMFYDSSMAARKDFKRFFWITWGLMALILFTAFRTLRGVLLPMGVTGLAVGWTLGLMVVMGETISNVGVMLPTLIAVVCFSDAVHVVAHYYELARTSDDKREVLLGTMEHMLTACFLTSVTTSAAFISLVVSKLSTIRQLGIWSSIGIMLGFFLISSMIPVILSWMPLPNANVHKQFKRSWFTQLLKGAVRLNASGGRVVPVMTLIVFLLSIGGISALNVETSMTAFLPETSSSMKGMAIIQENLAGFGSVEIELKGPSGCFEEIWALKEIRHLEAFLKKRPDVGSVLSIADLLQWVYTKLDPSGTDLLEAPFAEGLVAEGLFILTSTGRSKALSALVTDDISTARISARLRISGTGEQVAVLDDIQAYLSTRLDNRLQATVTGDTARIGQQILSVLRSLTDSFATTFLVIFMLMLWLLKSFKVALLAMVPNVLPVLLTIGVMGATGISLNFATVMITSIAIGIAVDNTIHILIRYRREMTSRADIPPAIENTIMHSGRALMFTSAVMAGGCGIFIFSSFSPNRHFGSLMAFTMLTALVMDLVVLPYLIRTFRLKL